MEAKEKAEKFLYDSYKELGNIENLNTMNKAKQLALIAADGVLKVALNIATDESIKYWEEVKHEIKNL